MNQRTFALLLCLTVYPVAAHADGAAVYKSKCLMCHGADGAGQTPAGKSMKAKPLSSDEVQGKSDEELAVVVADGKGKMPGYKSKLSAEEIDLVVKYIRSFAPSK